MASDPSNPVVEGVSSVVLNCAWGRLIFAHTFPDPKEVANSLLAEEPGKRDIAFYVTDPHIILNTAPRNLFMDPSHTYRIRFTDYRPREGGKLPIDIQPFSERVEIDQINQIYGRQQMVQVDPEEMLATRNDPRMGYVVAKSHETGEVVAVALGVDHHLAFGDIENGSSLWSLAADPQSPMPGLGEAMVRYLIEHYQAAGRTQLDLSVLHTNKEAIRLYTKLGFVRVPVFAIKRCNTINEPLFTGANLPDGFNPYATILIKEAARRGISVEPINPHKGYFRLTLGGRSICCRESLSDLTSAVALSQCDDKEMTRNTLIHADLCVPDQRIAGVDEAADRQFFEQHEIVVVKPARGEQGQGVAVGLKVWDDVEAAIVAAKKICDVVLMEECVAGQDLRIVVINYEVVAAAVRRPPEIVGTGTHTVKQLIDAASRRRAAATGGESRIPIDGEAMRCLADAGLDLDSVPGTGETIQVRNTANLHTGGTIHDVTEKLHPDLAAAATKAAEALEIPVVGLDFLVESPDGPQYAIIEANERPGLANHEPQPTAERFIDLLFPQTANHVSAERVTIS